MKLSFYVDGSNIDDAAKAVTSSVTEWIKATGSVATFIDQKIENGERQLGIQLNIRKKGELRDPLKKLYEIANKQKCEFAVGIIDEKTDETEEICYFGKEEGKPDTFEIANYLGIL